MAQLFEAQPGNDLPVTPNHNVCPTNAVHVVVGAADDAPRRLTAMRWGLLPPWYKTPTGGPLLINARAETIAEKPAFRSAVRQRRCLIPACGFYEWTKDAAGNRLPWYIRARDGAPLAFAGVWQPWTDPQSGAPMTTCAIVTTGANAALGHIHHRMPVILAAADWPLWLGEAGHGAAVLMRAAPDDLLTAHRVGTAVNSNRASGPELSEPIPAEGDPA